LPADINQGPKLAATMPVMTTRIAVSIGFPGTILAISTAIGTGSGARQRTRDRAEHPGGSRTTPVPGNVSDYLPVVQRLGITRL
jgi:hypothetical protein